MSPTDAPEPDTGSRPLGRDLYASHKAFVVMVLLPLLLGRRLSFAPATADISAVR